MSGKRKTGTYGHNKLEILVRSLTITRFPIKISSFPLPSSQLFGNGHPGPHNIKIKNTPIICELEVITKF